jgi:hypothetical protein
MQVYPSTDREIRQHVIFQKLAAVRKARNRGSRVTLSRCGQANWQALPGFEISPGTYSPCDGLGSPQKPDLQ